MTIPLEVYTELSVIEEYFIKNKFQKNLCNGKFKEKVKSYLIFNY